MIFTEKYKLLWKVFRARSQAEFLEKEWQRLQQDEHDFFFEFQISHNVEVKERMLYKKGVADGIKWCLRAEPIYVE